MSEPTANAKAIALLVWELVLGFPWLFAVVVLGVAVLIGSVVSLVGRRSFERRWRGPQYRRGAPRTRRAAVSTSSSR